MSSSVFIPDRDRHFYLLRQHRQPLAENVARRYIEGLTAPGELIVDPFASSATTARVGIGLGRRVIAVESNPLVALAARVEASLPPAREIAGALTRLGEVQKEDQTLQAHIDQLYASTCANCGGPVIVHYFVHSRELDAPVQKVYDCASCGARRDPTTDADRARAAEFPRRGLQYHLLVERVGGNDPEHGKLIRELLQLYTSRNLYALVTLTLKLDAEFEDDAVAGRAVGSRGAEPHLREILAACLIHALDVGTNLYSGPDAWPERKPPDTFVEINIWRALEDAAAGLSQLAPGFTLSKSPADLVNATTPSAFVGHGSARSLADTWKGAEAALVLASPARLDPLFWELSYLWTRWVLGKNVAAALEPFLDKSRQRWSWYGNALAAAFEAIAQFVRRETRVVFAFPAGSHAMIEALMLAAAPHFQLREFAFRPHPGASASTEFGAVRGDYRVAWSSIKHADETKVEERQPGRETATAARQVATEIRIGALTAAGEVLSARGEPLAYSWLHHRALEQLARDGVLAKTMAAKLNARDNPFQFLRREIEAGLKEGYARDLDHLKEEHRVLWRRNSRLREAVPLAERVDQATSELFAQNSQLTSIEFEDRLLERFPGLLTPEVELLQVCAAAYADEREGIWVRRNADVDEELARSRELVAQLGKHLGYDVVQGAGVYDLVWRTEKMVPGSSSGAVQAEHVQEDSHVFLFRARVNLPDLVRRKATPLRGFIVIPESQVALAREKLRRLPTLGHSLAELGWEFLRLPFVEMLLQEPIGERGEFKLAWGLEPALVKGKEQMELF